MEFRDFFAVKDLPEGEEDPGGWGVTVEPSKRLQKLHPTKAITALRGYVDELNALIAHFHQIHGAEDLEKPANMAKMRNAVFELEVSESYLAYLNERHKILH